MEDAVDEVADGRETVSPVDCTGAKASRAVPFTDSIMPVASPRKSRVMSVIDVRTRSSRMKRGRVERRYTATVERRFEVMARWPESAANDPGR